MEGRAAVATWKKKKEDNIKYTFWCKLVERPKLNFFVYCRQNEINSRNTCSEIILEVHDKTAN